MKKITLLMLSALLFASCTNVATDENIKFNNAVLGEIKKAEVSNPTFDASVIRMDQAVKTAPAAAWTFTEGIKANVVSGVVSIASQTYNIENYTWFIGYSSDKVLAIADNKIPYNLTDLQTDILAAAQSAAGNVNEKSSVALAYHHMLSKISFQLEKGTDLSAAQVVSKIVIKDMPTSASLTFAPAPTIEFGTTKADYTITKDYTVAIDASAVIPVTEFAYVPTGLATIDFVLTVNGSEKNVTVTIPSNTAAETHYLITFTVNDRGISTPTATLTDWTPGTGVNGDIEL